LIPLERKGRETDFALQRKDKEKTRLKQKEKAKPPPLLARKEKGKRHA